MLANSSPVFATQLRLALESEAESPNLYLEYFTMEVFTLFRKWVMRKGKLPGFTIRNYRLSLLGQLWYFAVAYEILKLQNFCAERLEFLISRREIFQPSEFGKLVEYVKWQSDKQVVPARDALWLVTSEAFSLSSEQDAAAVIDKIPAEMLKESFLIFYKRFGAMEAALEDMHGGFNGKLKKHKYGIKAWKLAALYA